MAAVGNITINNGEATPVAKTYNPSVVQSDLVSYQNRSGGIVLGFPEISIGNRMPSKNANSYKVTARVKIPILEQTSPSTATGIQPAPTLAYTLIGNVELVMPSRCTLAERKDLLAFVKNFMSNAAVTTAVENFEMPY